MFIGGECECLGVTPIIFRFCLNLFFVKYQVGSGSIEENNLHFPMVSHIYRHIPITSSGCKLFLWLKWGFKED